MKFRTIEPTKEDMLPLSNAKEIKILLKKYKKLIRSYYEATPFEEPALILLRRTGRGNFYENATKGRFTFTHSDGTERYIILNQENIQILPYGNKDVRMYICHEDHPTPLPTTPIMTTEMMNLTVEKTLNDIRSWKAPEILAQTKFVKTIIYGILALVGLYIIYTLIKPETAPITANQIAEAIRNTTTHTQEVIIK